VRVLIVGGGGQVARALLASAPPQLQVHSPARQELDITNPEAIAAVVGRLAPQVIINAAAYTAVDRAESEPEQAWSVNADGPKLLALAALRCGARLLHLSTDFVFDGTASRPYPPDARPNPLSEYGRSKLAGERSVCEVLGERGLVLRTSWVYAAQGRNFMLTMLRLMGAGDPIRVVADQVGTPTAAASVAEAVWTLVRHPQLQGVHHWTDAGVASWYDFAVAIAEEAAILGLLAREPRVVPIATEDYPTPARRPPYSVLEKRSMMGLNLAPVHWRQRLRGVLRELRGA